MKTKTNDICMFLLLTFLMPFFFVLCQRTSVHPVLQLLFYGLEAASPSIAALLVQAKNRQLLSFFKKNFTGGKSGTALLFPCVFSLAPMLLARLCTGSSSSGHFLNYDLQFIVIVWAFFAEEIGWRGYLRPYLKEHLEKEWYVPVITGIIWFLWHYHYFYQNGIEVPLLCFFIGCIAESFVYEYLLQWSDGNLLSSMMYHFSWNLCLHLFAINPADHAGNEVPYILMTLFEVCMVLLLLAHDKSKQLHSLRTKY